MVEITLFEIHLDDATVDADAEAVANAPLSGLFGRGRKGASDEGDTGDEGGTEAVSEADGGGGGRGRFLVLLLALAAAAGLAWLVRGADESAD